MRRAILVVAASVFVAAVAPAAGGSQIGATATVAQAAHAVWMEREDGKRVLYFAAAFHNSSQRWPSMGAVGRAECKEVRHGHHTGLVCRARQPLQQLGPGDFVVNPALSSATLKLTIEDVPSEVVWTGRGQAPEFMWHQHAGNDVQEVLFMAGFHRRADASGTVLGRAVEDARSAGLAEQLWTVVSLDYFDTNVFRVRDGDLVVRARLRR